MWKIHEPPKDVKNITLNETIALDSNYGKDNHFVLSRPLKNIISLYPNTLIIKNFSIDVTDFHYKSMADNFISSTNHQKLGQLTLLDFKYILVSISSITNNQIGSQDSNISECSGIFIMDNMYSSSTNNALTGKSNIKVHTASTSPDSLVLILNNISSKKIFLPYLGGLNYFDVKLMLPGGREIKRKNEVLHVSTKKDEVIKQSFTCAGSKPTLSNNNKTLTFDSANDIDLVFKNYIIKKTTTTSIPEIEYRVITDKTDTTIIIDKAFTNNHVDTDTLKFLELPIMWKLHNENKRFLKIKVKEFFSPLEFKKGDMIRFTGSELLFLDREKGHMIVDVKHKGPSTTHSHLKNILIISDDYSVSEGEIKMSETDTIDNMNFSELHEYLSGKSIEIRNLSNNFLLTVDAEINIQNL